MDVSIYIALLNVDSHQQERGEIVVKDGVIEFPEMYALAKTGSIRTYKISIKDHGDHATLTTQKRVTQKGVWTQDDYEYWSGVNIGKSNETTYLEQAINNANSIISKLRDAGFTEELPTGKFNTDANGNIKPMLAKGFNEKYIKFPCLVQPKYDGVRCTISEGANGIDIISRLGKPYKIPHLEKWAKELDPLGIYTEEELSILQYTRDIPNEIKDTMSKLTQNL